MHWNFDKCSNHLAVLALVGPASLVNWTGANPVILDAKRTNACAPPTTAAPPTSCVEPILDDFVNLEIYFQ